MRHDPQIQRPFLFGGVRGRATKLRIALRFTRNVSQKTYAVYLHQRKNMPCVHKFDDAAHQTQSMRAANTAPLAHIQFKKQNDFKQARNQMRFCGRSMLQKANRD